MINWHASDYRLSAAAVDWGNITPLVVVSCVEDILSKIQVVDSILVASGADEINFIASTAQPRQVGPVSLTGSILLPSISYPSHHDLNSLEHPGLEAFTR